MRYEIAQIVPQNAQCQRNYHVGNLAIVAVNPTSTLLETAYPRHLYPHWQTTQHTLQLPVQYYDLLHQLRCRTTSRYLFVLLLRLLVAIVGYINNLQLRSLLNLNPFRATPPRNYDPPKSAASHQAAANQPASQTGEATRVRKWKKRDGIFSNLCFCEYAISVKVSFKDKYTFKPTGTLNYKLLNAYYQTAHWLQENGHAQPVDHEMTFDRDFNVLFKR